jgi:hypothetical protein
MFFDLPIGKKENKMAVTGYSVYDYDFGLIICVMLPL